MRTYLVVIDESHEAMIALRFAAYRAARTHGSVIVLAIIVPQDFVAFGGVQATIEAEAQETARELIAKAADAVAAETGIQASIMIKTGDPGPIVRSVLAEDKSIAALVLGAVAHGAPGPLVSHFTGVDCGTLPCTVMIVPGAIDSERLMEVI